MISPCASERKRSYPAVASLSHTTLTSGDNDVRESDRKRVKRNFKTKSLPVTEYGKGITNDEIHDRIEYCPVFKAIMDTAQVQRLRELKQLATANIVYKNATTTRFEHSLGVAHLAEKMAKHLMEDQPNLKITKKDVLCIKLAGLMHDLGHGPFSHVYEDLVNNENKKYLVKYPHLQKEYEGLPPSPVDPDDPHSEWGHESASLMMIDAALKSLGLAIDMDRLDEPLLQIGDGVKAESMCVYSPCAGYLENVDPNDILTSRDFVFIKECIIGKPIGHSPVDRERSGFLGRPYRSQEFLYDIVANRHNGLDVDKMDYFARDSKRALGKDALFTRMIDEAVVAWGECPQPKTCHACTEHAPRNHLMICYKDKMYHDGSLMGFFNSRFKLHTTVYKHHASVAATFMIKDILSLADPYFRLPTYLESELTLKSDDKDIKELPISRAMLNETSYLRLRDPVIDQIAATTRPELRDARLLIERWCKRDLYKCIARKRINLTKPNEAAIWQMTEDEIAQEMLSIKGEHRDEDGNPVQLEEQDIIVEKYKIHHGAGEANPVGFVRFLDKQLEKKLGKPVDELPVAIAHDVSKDSAALREMQAQFVRVYCRGKEESGKQELLAHVFKLWEMERDAQGVVTANTTCESDLDDDEQRESVPLTQEEEESSVGSPQRGIRQYDSDGEPSPFPAGNNRW